MTPSQIKLCSPSTHLLAEGGAGGGLRGRAGKPRVQVGEPGAGGRGSSTRPSPPLGRESAVQLPRQRHGGRLQQRLQCSGVAHLRETKDVRSENREVSKNAKQVGSRKRDRLLQGCRLHHIR